MVKLKQFKQYSNFYNTISFFLIPYRHRHSTVEQGSLVIEKHGSYCLCIDYKKWNEFGIKIWCSLFHLYLLFLSDSIYMTAHWSGIPGPGQQGAVFNASAYLCQLCSQKTSNRDKCAFPFDCGSLIGCHTELSLCCPFRISVVLAIADKRGPVTWHQENQLYLIRVFRLVPSRITRTSRHSWQDHRHNGGWRLCTTTPYRSVQERGGSFCAANQREGTVEDKLSWA